MFKRILAGTIAALAVTSTASAQASTSDAFTRCLNNWGPDSWGSYTLQGNNPVATKAALPTITTDNVVRITGSGRVNYGGSAGVWGPAGNGVRSVSGWAFPGASEYSVVGYWKPTSSIIPFDTCAVLGGSPSEPPKLYLAINDAHGYYGDNSGSYSITVWVFHR